ncbi:MAG: helix-turn-helix transcriptional regulator [Myxococcales bacterium]|nr:helix-turn-helix transcriptional regulator [Myxococcales bacterium]MDD9967647.1 helix-turn-helix transcriptional regulator [Myxococcales bacterium]
MPATSLLVTDRPAFEEAWRPALLSAGLSPRTVHPEALGQVISSARAVVIDGACEYFDEDELLATAGLAKALSAAVAVVLPTGGGFANIEDLLSDLCPGMLVHNGQGVDPFVQNLARRSNGDRSRRFEYLTVSPRPGELLAILGDGQTTLIARPLSDADDGSEVTSIELSDNAESAILRLGTGGEISLRAAGLSERPPAGSLNGDNGTFDGVKLGARLRALRLGAGLTQAELARRTGIHRPNIARVEAGRHTPSLETLARLANAIGVPTTRVLADE